MESNSGEVLFDICHVSHTFETEEGKTFDALKDVTAQIKKGEFTAIIGTNGSGKSTLARHLNALLIPTEGELIVEGMRTSDAGRVWDIRQKVGMVFQNPSAALNPVMTVAQQVGLPLYLHYDLSLAERSERVTAVLAKVGLGEDVLVKYPHELSGGQRQRVGIATALVTSPRLIIADEPTTALDSITQRQIVDLLTSLVDESGASMLFITHDFAVLNLSLIHI